MKRLFRYVLMFLLGFSVWSLTVTVWATPIEMQFSFDMKNSGGMSIPPPTSPVTGTLLYEADSLTDPITSLISIDLMINGYTYGISEIGFINAIYSNPAVSMVGGVVDDINGIVGGGDDNDDFYLIWNRVTLGNPVQLAYAVSGDTNNQIWYSEADPEITAAAVPVPATMFLLGLGILGLAGINRRKK
ncbi:MAG: PEP-CTERM sorting domain-containing protein [Desulfobacula sp.]|uniref:PEP-CTERM sorting domain-containing protein n=1 Tax=Desulfobacula sp. TaxID=2593537 RepID=UPI0025C4DF5C|nr:PEP-CTERM sorting domain-containing protein [Desulfobacula sp.]MCD4720976.1 PEP-CTERM sorting domain-containing protein [Desulfobacula sp.]